MLLWMVLSAVFASLPRQAPDEHVVGDVVRFLRGDRTLVNGFVRVPHRMLTRVTQGPGSFAAYRVDFRVMDAQGTVLATDAWSRRVPWSSGAVAGAQSVEPFAFAVAPGSYTVSIAVQDSASGMREAVELPLTGFAARPQASDLLLAYGIRTGRTGDTLTGAGEVRKGNLFIESAPDLALTPTHAALWYYCEVYRDSAGTVPWMLRVVGSDGHAIVASPTTTTAIAAGGGPIAASIDLGGLPPGTYTLALTLGSGGDTVTREAPFRMGGFETERAVAAAAEGAPADDMFSQATEATLDSLFGPLVYLSKQEELSPYEGLTVDGKRRFLREFWHRRDPTAGTPENELQTRFYARIADANRRFRESGAAQVPGWRTDRGRVFMQRGDPDDVLRKPQSGPDRPWEAWKYTKERITKFVFLDLTRLGNYSLIYSDDKEERSPMDWTTMLSSDAIAEIQRF
ncbi:MAG TPA: GWxTD domain-containing protein [Gemmatimonadales bacterium]|nr:GWxTD domain-containing protein [Gemmatimonadales bacterium]